MKNRKPMTACLISTCLALVLMIATYAAFAKVDLVFMKDGEEVCRQDNVCALSAIDDPAENIPDGVFSEGEEICFTYVNDGENVDFDHSSFEFRGIIVKTVMTNLIEFKWSEASQVIVLTAK